jgi:hypothetical protein
MKLTEAFPSKWLKAEDLKGQTPVVTIAGVSIEKIGQDDGKVVLKFRGKEKGMVCNVTNANMIAEIAGSDDTDNWFGVPIMLYVAKVDYQGRRVDAIRVDFPPANGKQQPPAPAPRAPVEDDDISF